MFSVSISRIDRFSISSSLEFLEDNSHDFIFSNLVLYFQFSLDLVGACPSISIKLEAIFKHI